MQATTRLRQNTLYFRVNYLIIVVAVTAVCMVLSPSSLAVLAVLALLWIYIFIVRKDPLVLGGRTFRCGNHCCSDAYAACPQDAASGWQRCLTPLRYKPYSASLFYVHFHVTTGSCTVTVYIFHCGVASLLTA